MTNRGLARAERIKKCLAEAWVLCDHEQYREEESKLDDALYTFSERFGVDSQDWTDEAARRLEKEGLL